eukprot:5239371-Prymnesium_polylepis.1
MISGISSRPPRWICPAERQRASSTHVKKNAAPAHPPAATPRHATQTMRLAAANLHLDDIVCCRRVG